MTLRIKIKGQITTAHDFAEEVSRLANGTRFLFRGQNTDKPLRPKIARHHLIGGVEIIQVEKAMLSRLRKESAPFLTGKPPESDWDWLSVAQHQGVSTRLLDWSANALAALWFAVSVDPPEDEPNGVVWALTVADSDLKSPTNEEDIWDLRRTYVFQPFHIDRRIVAQSGWFSVHKFIEGKGTFVPLDSNASYKHKLKKFVIPRASFSQIRRELRLLGITRSTLFPDLGGLCADIDEEFLHNQRDPANI